MVAQLTGLKVLSASLVKTTAQQDVSTVCLELHFHPSEGLGLKCNKN